MKTPSSHYPTIFNETKNMTFQFAYTGENTQSIKSVSSVENATWMRILSEFTDFLSGIYGYDIKSKVVVDRGFGYEPLRQQQFAEAFEEALDEDF